MTLEKEAQPRISILWEELRIQSPLSPANYPSSRSGALCSPYELRYPSRGISNRLKGSCSDDSPSRVDIRYSGARQVVSCSQLSCEQLMQWLIDT